MPARFELEDTFNSLTARDRRRLLNPWADFVWRNGRLFVRQSRAERAARRKRGSLKDLVFDVWMAYHFGDDATIEWFLRDYLHLMPNQDRSSEDLRKALYHVIGTSWADRPAKEIYDNPPPWYDPTTKNQKGYLYKAIRREAERHNRDREAADKPWRLKRLRKRDLPDQCGFDPAVHGRGDEGRDDPGTGIGLTSPDLLGNLAEWQRRELERFYVKQAEEVLPERQYQVFTLRVEGYSYKHIAVQLGITPSAAKAHMSHARKNTGLRKVGERWM